MEEWESDSIVEKWIRENDATIMSLPSIESDPHILISKVRKHYMEHLIKLLAFNYENKQKLLNKNIYLPSAIWRCAKMLEMSAAQGSMMVLLYRKNITDVMNDLKDSTKKGLLYRKLYECLHYAPPNDKKVQAGLNGSKQCNCPCTCNQRKRVKRISESPKDTSKTTMSLDDSVVQPIDLQVQPQPVLTSTNCTNSMSTIGGLSNNNTGFPPNLPSSDDIMLQLDKLFQGDENDDDLFESILCTTDNSDIHGEYARPANVDNVPTNSTIKQVNQETQHMPFDERLEKQHKPFEERLALLSGVLVNNIEASSQDKKHNVKIPRISKWLCEEYFQKVKLFELLDLIRDSDRSKLARVKQRLLDIFGEDTDDEDVVSPLEESSDFVSSCKERITPWVVKILTPYYVSGRIRGKSLFKSLAKHLIHLIYQCSKYPHEYEVQSFVKDFLDTHKLIRCEADYKQFRIENFEN